MNKDWNIDRRHFLRGAAGALVPLPFLNLMENAVAKNVAGEAVPPLPVYDPVQAKRRPSSIVEYQRRNRNRFQNVALDGPFSKTPGRPHHPGQHG